MSEAQDQPTFDQRATRHMSAAAAEILDIPEIRSVVVAIDYREGFNEANTQKGVWRGPNGPVWEPDGIVGSIHVTTQMLEQMYRRLAELSQQLDQEVTSLAGQVQERQQELQDLDRQIEEKKRQLKRLDGAVDANALSMPLSSEEENDEPGK